MSAVTQWQRRLARRARQLFAPRQLNQDMSEEMRFHLEMETLDLERQGLPAAASRHEATRRFGGETLMQETARDAWPLRRAVAIARDARFAARSLRRTPTFTIAAVVALALGIGANAAIFSLIDTIAFRPLAVRAPDELVSLFARRNTSRDVFSYPAFADLRAARPGFRDLAAFLEGPVNAGLRGAASAVWAMHTSDNYFDLLGVRPAAGRFYREGELRAPVVVLGHAFWRSHYHADPRVVGSTLQINGTPLTIIGVAPPQFSGTKLFAFVPSVWLPAGLHALTIPSSDGLLDNRDAARFSVLARLEDGMTIARATRALTLTLHEFGERFPDAFKGARAEVVSNRTPINPDFVSPDQIRAIGAFTLFGISLVLFIACANVTNLLLARLNARTHEIGLRLSLGASRGRLVQQFLVESMTLALLGGLVAIPVAAAAIAGLAQMPPKMAYATDLRPPADLRVVAYAVGATIVAAFAFGLAPALAWSRQRSGSGLRIASGSGSGSAKRSRAREWIVLTQVALSMMVLIAGAVVARGLQHARSIPPGFDVDGAAVVTLDPQLSPSYDSAATRTFYRRVVRELGAIPGVTSVSRAVNVPLDANYATRRVFGVGESMAVEEAPVADYNVVSPGFFSTIRMPLVDGREFTAADTASPHDVVIVNELFAARFWPGRSAIGRRIKIGSPAAEEAEVIGVVRMARYESIGEQPMLAVWRSLDRSSRSRTTIIVRTSASVDASLPVMRRAVQSIDPEMPLIGLGSLRDHISITYSAIESTALGAMSFAVLATILAVSGIFGVVAYNVSQRQRELGVRMALGATTGVVVREIIVRSLRVTGAGVGVALTVVLAIPAGIDRMLYGVSHRDPMLLASAIAGFILTAIVGAYLPARRVSRLDPMRVLRQD